MVARNRGAGPTEKDEVCSLRGKDIQRILAEEFGLLRSLPAIYLLLHRLNDSYLRPRPRHRKADPEKIESFKKEWPEKLKAIAAAHPDKRLRVYVQDESRFGHHFRNNRANASAEKVPKDLGRFAARNLPKQRN